MHYDLRNTEECGWLSTKFIQEWDTSKHKSYPFLRTKFNTFKYLIFMTQFLALLGTLFSFSGPILVSLIISYVGNKDSTTEDGLLLILYFILSRIAIIIVSAQSTQYSVRNFSYKNIE